MSNNIKELDSINQDVTCVDNNFYEHESIESYQSQYEPMGDFVLDTRNLDNQEINVDKFKKGIDEYSTIAGKMSVLTSMGIDSKIALEFVERELIREYEIKLLKIK